MLPAPVAAADDTSRMVRLHYQYKDLFLRPTSKQVIERYNVKFRPHVHQLLSAASSSAAAASFSVAAASSSADATPALDPTRSVLHHSRQHTAQRCVPERGVCEREVRTRERCAQERSAEGGGVSRGVSRAERVLVSLPFLEMTRDASQMLYSQ